MRHTDEHARRITIAIRPMPLSAVLLCMLVIDAPALAGEIATVYRGTLTGAGEVVLQLTRSDASDQMHAGSAPAATSIRATA